MTHYLFLSTRPRGARRIHCSARVLVISFLSTRPRGARRCRERVTVDFAGVSIHAPAWGATWRSTPRRSRLTCFYPRARVGRDTPAPRTLARLACFYPRARVGRDVRGRLRPGSGLGFYPRARVGRDPYLRPRTWSFRRFLSTRPRGARRASMRSRSPTRTGFYPRARVGRDSRGVNTVKGWFVSIHAPAWGATCDHAQTLRWEQVFLSTRPRGARPLAVPPQPGGQSFYPRARVGRDVRGDMIKPNQTVVSIHAPAWGATFCLHPICQR